MFDWIDEPDALISTTGKVHFGRPDQFTAEQFDIGLRDKLMGQNNLVSPAVIEEALPAYGAYFSGVKAVPAAEAALGYVKSVEGLPTGRVYRMGWPLQACRLMRPL